MERAPFITPAMSIVLDAVRGGAALVVLVGHMVQMGIYTGPFPFSDLMQHNAVIVFFVLSGLVIAHSVHARPGTLKDYAIARAARILPVSLTALAFGALLYMAVSAQGLVPSEAPAPYDDLTASSLLLPAIFLSESGAAEAGPVWNPPYWSLVYEVWFYAIFAAGFFLKGRTRIAFVVLLGFIAGWRILLMLPIWLLGAALARYRPKPDLTKERAIRLAIVGVIAMLLASEFARAITTPVGLFHKSFGYDLKYSHYFVSDYLFAIGIALLFVAARPFADAGQARLERIKRPIDWLAGFSFSLYIFHWPIISALSAHGIGVSDSVMGFAALAGGVAGTCALIATVTEHRSRDIRRWMTRKLEPRVPVVPA
ncbi:acyltransferase [Blastomonas marina]|uniref:acyltransferase family protein n=1 Tax=Blastomonas marina TaxID=1867408 RepID=UPI002AC9A080|nr:acyltransferase [Blastomonas marina]WPZ05185.1 acyltransferase [Blastomonas marina]